MRQYAADDGGFAGGARRRPTSGRGADVDGSGRVARSAQPLRRQPGLGRHLAVRHRRRRDAHSPRHRIPFPRVTMPIGLAGRPDGRHVYVANQGDATIGVYDVDAAGALTFASSAAAEHASPVQIALQPDGDSAYVTNSTSRLGLAVRRRARTARSRPRRPPPSPPGRQPVGIAVSPDGANVYVTNQVRQRHHRAVLDRRRRHALDPRARRRSPPGPCRRAIVATADRVYVANVGWRHGLAVRRPTPAAR